MPILRSIVPCCGFGNGLDPYFSWGRRVDAVAEGCEPCVHARRNVILKLHSQWISAMVACKQDIEQQTAVPELAEVTGRWLVSKTGWREVCLMCMGYAEIQQGR